MTNLEEQPSAIDLKAYVQAANGLDPTRRFLSRHPALLDAARQWGGSRHIDNATASISDAASFLELLQAAVELMPPTLQRAMTILYGLTAPWRQIGSSAKRKEACNLLYDEMNWSTFRDRHELGLHEDVSHTLHDILHKRPPILEAHYEFLYSPGYRNHCDWPAILRSYLSMARSARVTWKTIKEREYLIDKGQSANDVPGDFPIHDVGVLDTVDAYISWRLTELRRLLRIHIDLGLPWILEQPSYYEWRLARSAHLVASASPFDGVQQAWLRRVFDVTYGEVHLFVPTILSTQLGQGCLQSWRNADRPLREPEHEGIEVTTLQFQLVSCLDRFATMLEEFLHGPTPQDEVLLEQAYPSEEYIPHRRRYEEIDPLCDNLPIYNDYAFNVLYTSRDISAFPAYMGITGGTVGTEWKDWVAHNLIEIAQTIFELEEN